MATKQRRNGVNDLWNRHALEIILDAFPGAELEEGSVPLSPGEAVAELLTSTRELVNFMRTSEPARMERPGWKRVAAAVAAAEASLDGEADIDELLEDWATPGRATDPETSTKAASVASIGSGSARFKVATVYFDNPGGLTADEAVKLADLGDLRSPWRRVYDLKGMGVLTKTGEERLTSAGAMAEVYVMTEMARQEWAERFADPSRP